MKTAAPLRAALALLLALALTAPLAAQSLTPPEVRELRALLLKLLAEAPEPEPEPEPEPDPKPAPRLVTTAAELTTALKDVQPGETIALAHGVYVGAWTFPSKAGEVTILGPGELRSPSSLPAAQVGSHWTIFGLTFSAAVPNGDLVRIGTSTQTLQQVPMHVRIRNVHFRGDPILGQKRGLAANGADVVVEGSRCTDIKIAGQDTQCVLAWNTPGPLTFINNDLEAAGENLMIGGADPSIPGVVPSDILIRGNRFTKPMEWKGHPSGWTVKNLLELKTGKRVTITGNLFEHNWLHAQTGWAILMKSTNQDGWAPWSETSDVLFEGNEIRNVASGINLAGRPEKHPAVAMSRVTIRNNRIATNRAVYGGQGWCFLVQAVADVTIERNTCAQDGPVALYFGEAGINERFILRRNILVDPSAGDAWGIMGSGSGEGLKAIERWAPGAVFAENLVVTPTPWLYGPSTQNRLETTMPADTTGYGATLLEAQR